MNSDHISEQLKLFLPQEAAADVGTHRMNADFNFEFAKNMTRKISDVYEGQSKATKWVAGQANKYLKHRAGL